MQKTEKNKRLVIVESATKARTIKSFLSSEYDVVSCVGHIRNLPSSATEIPKEIKNEEWASFAIDYNNNFKLFYVIAKEKKKVIQVIKEKLKKADELIVATDEDREGESIGWHLMEVLKPKIPVYRMVFHEITKTAVEQSLKNFREINKNLVLAQETRVILDRLVGYSISPLLWRKIGKGLSAGRVQSVALKLIVQKEYERMAFQKGFYWNIKANLQKDDFIFDSVLTHIEGKRIAVGRDFDEKTGELKNKKNIILLNEKEVNEILETIRTSRFQVNKIEIKDAQTKPPSPFTTPSLQQEANRRLRFSARQTMQVAQKLYEKGYITYLRTDSMNIAKEALADIRRSVKQHFGNENISVKPLTYKSKMRTAQEAHEAIRPAGNNIFISEHENLLANEQALYKLIWNRTMACQMVQAIKTHHQFEIKVDKYTFFTSVTETKKAGFLLAYSPTKLETTQVPTLKVGETLLCNDLETAHHETKPPARFNEASLIQQLEKDEIGRPSTYASIISTILDRKYAQKINENFVPTIQAFAVEKFLTDIFSDLINVNFTAEMEIFLDQIAEGKQEWLPYVKNFFFNEKGLRTRVEENKKITGDTYRKITVPKLNEEILIGKFGPYVRRKEKDEYITTSLDENLILSELTTEKINQLFQKTNVNTNEIGIHPVSGKPIYSFLGRYGPYIQHGMPDAEQKKVPSASIPKFMAEVNLDVAIRLLELPKTLGEHPQGGTIQIAVGKYGPYLIFLSNEQKKSFSLNNRKDFLDVSLEESIQIIDEKKDKKYSTKSKEPLKIIGMHPTENSSIDMYKGPYGFYLKCKGKNISIPEGKEETLSLQDAVKLIEKKFKKKKK